MAFVVVVVVVGLQFYPGVLMGSGKFNAARQPCDRLVFHPIQEGVEILLITSVKETEISSVLMG